MDDPPPIAGEEPPDNEYEISNPDQLENVIRTVYVNKIRIDIYPNGQSHSDVRKFIISSFDPDSFAYKDGVFSIVLER